LATSSSTTAVNSRQANRLPEEEEAEVRDGVPLPESRGVGKRLQTDWTVSLGENARDIYIGRTLVGLTPSQFDILVIGEHSLFWIREGGVLKLQKRIDFNASASCLYTSGSEGVSSSLFFFQRLKSAH
jgi:Bardet-Biedl syndrome 9 protein